MEPTLYAILAAWGASILTIWWVLGNDTDSTIPGPYDGDYPDPPADDADNENKTEV